MNAHNEGRYDEPPKKRRKDRPIKPPQIGHIHSKISIARQDKEKQIHRDVLFIDCVPRSTKRAFKAACVAKGKRGESMRDAVIRLMRFYAQNHGIIPGQEEEDGG